MVPILLSDDAILPSETTLSLVLSSLDLSRIIHFQRSSYGFLLVAGLLYKFIEQVVF